MDINKPLNRRKALKIMGLGALGTCIPQLPAIAKERKKKKNEYFCSKTTTKAAGRRGDGGEWAGKVCTIKTCFTSDCSLCLCLSLQPSPWLRKMIRLCLKTCNLKPSLSVYIIPLIEQTYILTTWRMLKILMIYGDILQIPPC